MFPEVGEPAPVLVEEALPLGAVGEQRRRRLLERRVREGAGPLPDLGDRGLVQRLPDRVPAREVVVGHAHPDAIAAHPAAQPQRAHAFDAPRRDRGGDGDPRGEPREHLFERASGSRQRGQILELGRCAQHLGGGAERHQRRQDLGRRHLVRGEARELAVGARLCLRRRVEQPRDQLEVSERVVIGGEYAERGGVLGEGPRARGPEHPFDARDPPRVVHRRRQVRRRADVREHVEHTLGPGEHGHAWEVRRVEMGETSASPPARPTALSSVSVK
ncbi:MAG: hypothetical protein IPJ34_16525 [Myxococcales bacterium]|nr:hypothetical protein [Myxococcales bacterium]